MESYVPLNERELNFLACVAQNKGQSFINICNALSMNNTTVRPVRETLAYRGLIRVEKTLVGRGRSILLYPTEKGLELLRNIGAKGVQEERREEKSSQQGPKCAHYWIIQPSTGADSKGECQTCHAIRKFKNSIEVGDDPMASPGLD